MKIMPVRCVFDQIEMAIIPKLKKNPNPVDKFMELQTHISKGNIPIQDRAAICQYNDIFHACIRIQSNGSRQLSLSIDL